MSDNIHDIWGDIGMDVDAIDQKPTIPGGLFVSSQILAILVGILIVPVQIESNIADTRVQFLLLLDILCVLFTAWYLNKAVYVKEFIEFDVGDALK